MRNFLIGIFLFLVSCSAPAPAPSAHAPPAHESKKIVEPQITPANESPAAVVPAHSLREQVAEREKSAAVKPAAPSVQVWKLTHGHLDQQVAGRVIDRIKEKSGKMTTVRCWDYWRFAVTESRTEGVVGAGEILIRVKGEKPGHLCTKDYSGKILEIDQIEGFFAGVAGEYLLIDGADPSEGVLEFQLINTSDGKEVFKSQHNPGQEFEIEKEGARTGVRFYSRIHVGCELANEGESCWKKVLQDNGIRLALPMPGCAAAFKAAHTDMTESALVTVKARVPNLRSPKIEYLPGRPTCVPEP